MMDWWRAHHGIANDSKLAVVALRAKVQRCEVVSLWVACLDYASQHEPRGTVEGIDAEELSVSLDIPIERVQSILKVFRDKEMIQQDGTLTSWDKRQPRRERDDPTAADRKRKSRDGHAMSHQVTPCLAQTRLEEKRVDTEAKPPASSAKKQAEVDPRILAVATQIHSRHPAIRRCGLAEVCQRLKAILKGVPSALWGERLEAINQNHAGWCSTADWQKEGGAFAKGLDNWLAPTKGRFDADPPTLFPVSAPAPPRLLL